MSKNKIIKGLKNPSLFVSYLMNKNFLKFINDSLCLKIKYKAAFNKRLNFLNPITYNEKLQWLKIYDRNPLYCKLVDKYEVKQYIEKKLGKKYIIPTLGIWDNFEDINFDELPNSFVLKCTHDSGGLIICKNKKNLDLNKSKLILNKSLNQNYFYKGREWPYKKIKPRIIAEEYMVDESGYELKDYKFFCFDGKVKFMFTAQDRETNTKFDFYDDNFNYLNLKQGHENAGKGVLPSNISEMKRMAEILSANIPHVRIDFYNVNGRIYFGEYTFYHYSGFVPFEPNKWDYEFGKLININNAYGYSKFTKKGEKK